MHNDEPTLRDRLRRDALIEEVGEAIATCKPPQVFGVHGDWGLGKTSFLHQVRYYLTGENPQALDANDAPKSEHGGQVKAIWFDAWRYHAEAAPVVALLQEMRAQLSAKSKAVTAAKRYSEVALHSLDELTKKIGFQYAKFQQANRQWEAENLAATLPADSLRENLQKTIRLLLSDAPEVDQHTSQEPEPRLVIFVDDLDRCEPEAAYRLLEGLKVYLTLNNCVFVLGLNQKAVEGAIANRLAGGLTDEDARKDAQIRAASYLEKICQNVWHLPLVHPPGQFLCDLVEDGGRAAPHQVTWLREIVESRRCLPPNPRKIKGLANLVTRLCSRLPDDLQEDQEERGRNEMRKLLIVAYVHQFHHDLYVHWQASWMLFDAIHRWCMGEAKHDVLHSLELPMDVEEQSFVHSFEAAASEDQEMSKVRFLDPTRTNVFWIASIVRDLRDFATSETIDRYLAT